MTPRPRYVTWRYADRHYSKVHVLAETGVAVCGKVPGRELGRPTEPIPDAALCPECTRTTSQR